jgi:2-polyprenyl-6-methoxyphenol hydroxylase-like FAD-dependent oxidoreductase
MNALIAGGGIAGPVAAMALQRAGIEARVFESHPPADPEHASYFTVTANGLEALRSIGALELALSAGFPTRKNVLWNHAGRRLATLPLDSSLPGSPAAHTMKRSRLARLLQDEALRRGIPIEFGRRLVDAGVNPGGRAIARFAHGAEARGDVLIGADGEHSVVRRAIDPSAPAARYVGLTNFGGVTRGAAGGIEPEAWHLIFGRHAFFGYQATPAGDVIWFVNLPRSEITPEERAATGADEWKRRLIEQFIDDAGPAVELIEAGELELAADNTHDLGHVPTWHRGPLVIIGDAAHAPAPTSGQGASMAIEDGIVLAKALRDERSVTDAFNAYERLRRERVERIVAWGARGSSNKTPGAFGRVIRDLMLPVLFRFVVTEKSLRWMYDYRVDLDEPIGTHGALARV